jgi:hypothetical protein
MTKYLLTIATDLIMNLFHATPIIVLCGLGVAAVAAAAAAATAIKQSIIMVVSYVTLAQSMCQGLNVFV